MLKIFGFFFSKINVKKKTSLKGLSSKIRKIQQKIEFIFAHSGRYFCAFLFNKDWPLCVYVCVCVSP